MRDIFTKTKYMFIKTESEEKSQPKELQKNTSITNKFSLRTTQNTN